MTERERSFTHGSPFTSSQPRSRTQNNQGQTWLTSIHTGTEGSEQTCIYSQQANRPHSHLAASCAQNTSSCMCTIFRSACPHIRCVKATLIHFACIATSSSVFSTSYSSSYCARRHRHTSAVNPVPTEPPGAMCSQAGGRGQTLEHFYMGQQEADEHLSSSQKQTQACRS